ncbi:hypothetical protein Hypma_013198 [Hypsizygus marmoreus]|uniref:Uncharacterized protein n=1 Tax=Hypsizygus marmoreus TaxID=39966 RepID=A0A369JGK4_HYPMA|nr:hypothetical protein Hypma_013198 [Hypsizygus marmoreus]
MLGKVVSRVRRQFRRPKGHIQQPPELRRWSDFVNPFPHVSPGGYKRYYETHGMPEPKPIPPQFQVASSSKYQMISRQRKSTSASPKPSTSSTSQPNPPIDTQQLLFPSSSPSHSPNHCMKKSSTLSTIPESVSGPPSVRIPSLSNTSSLRRRRRRQLLRTPSVERDFPSRAPTIASTADLLGFSSNDSSSSHPEMLDTPPTTVEGLEDEEAGLLLKLDPTEEGVDPYDRPGSRSSYCTARSDFSDD